VIRLVALVLDATHLLLEATHLLAEVVKYDIGEP